MKGGKNIYFLCLVWSLQSLLSIGVGDLNEYMHSNIEISLALFLMLTSQLMMSLLIGLLINIAEKKIPKTDRIKSSILKILEANNDMNKKFRLENSVFQQITNVYKENVFKK